MVQFCTVHIFGKRDPCDERPERKGCNLWKARQRQWSLLTVYRSVGEAHRSRHGSEDGLVKACREKDAQKDDQFPKA
jgi:hypothetical protein